MAGTSGVEIVIEGVVGTVASLERALREEGVLCPAPTALRLLDRMRAECPPADPPPAEPDPDDRLSMVMGGECGEGVAVHMAAPPEDVLPFPPPKSPRQGAKYLRRVSHRGWGPVADVDVYDVCHAFGVGDACVSHAVKKLLCAGKRGKGSRLDDLRGALEAIQAAVAFAEAEAPPDPPAGPALAELEEAS